MNRVVVGHHAATAHYLDLRCAVAEILTHCHQVLVDAVHENMGVGNAVGISSLQTGVHLIGMPPVAMSGCLRQYSP